MSINIYDMKFFQFLGFHKKPKAPWAKYYDKKDMNLKIPNMSLYQYFRNCTRNIGDRIAFDYYGAKTTYDQLYREITLCAKAFLKQGIRRGDVVTICMPNTPEGIICFLALNKIGAVSNMIHPLSSENEIKDTLIATSSVMLVMIDIDYVKVKNIIKDTEVFRVICVRASDSMPWLLKMGYLVTQGRKTELPKKKDPFYLTWKEFLESGKNYVNHRYNYSHSKGDPAVMLHSGGTTGTPKAIVLSNANFIVLILQIKIRLTDLEPGDKCLAIMPIFHGFGLGVCVYAALCLKATCILVPQFNALEFDKLLDRYKPEFVIGVPTLFEALMEIKNDRLRLDYLKYVISGGDVLKPAVEEQINQFLADHGAKIKIIQGYGMSECLSAVALNFKESPKPGTIGIPFPGCYMGIFSPEDEELPYGVEGEICVCGPNVMLGYYNNEKETNEVLHLHKDGNIWLHSGDLGSMDRNGYITYTGRIKRMIISSGYNIYPNQIENVLEEYPAVMLSSAIGVPHPYKGEVVKVFLVLKKGYTWSKQLEEELRELCKKNLPRYSLPAEYEVRKALPKTMIGKVDFRKLQQENKEERERERNEANKKV